MTDPTPQPGCCPDLVRDGLSRRRLLTGAVAAGGAGLTTSVFGDAYRQAAFAATTGGNVLVVLSLRGGVDGLGLVVPHADPAYRAARPTIAVPTSALLGKDAQFGLHPQLAPISWLFGSGELAAVHAVGLAVPNRSHFSAMEEVEDADPGSTARRGWVNRMIGLDAEDDPAEAVHLTSSIVPTMLSGPEPSLAVDRIGDVSLVGAEASDGREWADRRRAQLDLMWAGGSSGIHGAYRSAVRTVDKVAPVALSRYTPQVTYPRAWPASGLSDALKDTAQLIKADVGTEVVSIDFGSWDMHSDYGTLDWGGMRTMVGGFAAVLDAFMRDLGPLRGRVTVVTISEFGRRIKENGNGGLDHGWGNAMLVAGAGVRGGAYYGSWPGLGSGNQVDDDLQVTTDYRNVLGEVIARRFPSRSVGAVFPGLSYAPLGLMA